jgi:predicted esterase
MAPTRVPKAADFADLSPALQFQLHFPEVPETTTAILILFHGLGDSEAPFANFARSVALPGVLAIAVRGVAPLPPAMLGLTGAAAAAPARHFHWGDDLAISPRTGDLDPDPGFARAADLVLGRLVRGVLVDRCGWDPRDMLLFGFGQGGSLALGLASRLRQGMDVAAAAGAADARVVDVTDGEPDAAIGTEFKGVVSIGGPLPASMVPTISSRQKARTPVLICRGRASELVDDEALEYVNKEFAVVKVVTWKKADDGMPGNREEFHPIMQFLAERLSNPGQ